MRLTYEASWHQCRWVSIHICPQLVTLCQKMKKISFFQSLKVVKVPQRHSSNVKSLVSMQDLKLIRLKSHDCHILMQQLLSVDICEILPKNVRHTITNLCFFFSLICCKVINPIKLDELEDEIVIIMCELEIFFLHPFWTSWFI